MKKTTTRKQTPKRKKITQARFDAIMDEHVKWCASVSPCRRADLTNLDLRKINFRDYSLTAVDFRGSDLRGLNLEGRDLECADLRGACACGANLSQAKLVHAVLDHADLRRVRLDDSDLYGTSLQAADLRGSRIRCARFQLTSLDGADLRGCDIDYSSWPLWCGSLRVKVDLKLGAQLLYHTLRALQSVKDPRVSALLRDEKVLALANEFSRVDDLGRPVPAVVPAPRRRRAENGTR